MKFKFGIGEEATMEGIDFSKQINNLSKKINDTVEDIKNRKPDTVNANGKTRKSPLTVADDLIEVAKELYNSRDDIKYDIEQIKERDPAAVNSLEVALLYSGFHAVTAHRVSHALSKRGYVFTSRGISQAAKFLTGIEIHPGATIGKGFFIDHGTGVVIGETTVIGDNCTVYQGVTLGGTGKDVGKRHPTLGNNVMVGAGAKVLGPFSVGDNTKIAAGAVVLKEVPECSTAVGIPAKVINKTTSSRAQDLDQVHIPDPVAKEIGELRSKLAELEALVAKMSDNKTEEYEDNDNEIIQFTHKTEG